ncbi:hypothetical protein J6590_073635 [Homalodisca vitripennis]|nr:hypothetical protein J6590_073635 [Homalodisca vitripennis]
MVAAHNIQANNDCLPPRPGHKHVPPWDCCQEMCHQKMERADKFTLPGTRRSIVRRYWEICWCEESPYLRCIACF